MRSISVTTLMLPILLLIFLSASAYGAGSFNFNDGTVQGWTLDQMYVTSSQEKFTPVIGYTLMNSSNALAAYSGSLLIGRSEQNDIYLESPDLSSNSDWQGITGYSVEVTRNLYSPCWGDVPDLFYFQLQMKVIDTEDGNAEKLFAEYDGSNFVFHEIRTTGQLYQFTWEPSWLTDPRYIVKAIRFRITGPGDVTTECWYRGDWSIDNVDAAAAGSVNTPVGTNVQVNLGSGVEVTFDNVTGAGNTSMTTSSIGTVPPDGYTISPPWDPQYYSITTTAAYSGNVNICIQYEEGYLSPLQEASLRLQIYETSPGQWQDITTSLDQNSDIICGSSSHLSEFAVMLDSSLPFGFWVLTNALGNAVNGSVDNGTVNCFTASGSNVFAGTEYSGVFRTTDKGVNWDAVNTGLTNLIVRALCTIGTDIFAGTWGGGVFLSTDNGANWTAVNTGLTSMDVTSLYSDGTNLLAGTWDGVFLSTNNGANWTGVNTGITDTHIRSLYISGGNFFAGSIDGLFMSSNNGSSWTTINTGLTNTAAISLAGIPANGGENLFVGTDGGGIFMSTNNGASWSGVSTGLANLHIPFLVASGTNLLAATWGGGVFASSNSGEFWFETNEGLQDLYIRSLLIDGTDAYAGTYLGRVRWRSTEEIFPENPEAITVISPNGGEDWQIGSQHEIAWTSDNFAGQVKLEYSIDGNASHIEIAAAADNDGSYMWIIPNTPSENCVVIVSDAADSQPFDISDGLFTISEAVSGEGPLVTNTSDFGEGSIREAINQANANPGPDTIRFEIPVSDAGYISGSGYWQIMLSEPLPALQDDSTLIDGSSQMVFAGDLNSSGPEIEINGQSIAGDGEGIVIQSSGNCIRGLAINQFPGIGIIIEESGHDNNEIYDNHIGVDPTGTQKRGNLGSIIILNSKANTIGFQDDNLANVIGGNNGPVMIEGTDATGNKIYANFIGTDKSMSLDLGNNSDGILINSGAHNNTIRGSETSLGPVVQNSNGAGIRFIGLNTNHNEIIRGSICKNHVGILLEGGANNNIPAPVITEADGAHIAGQAMPNNLIQFYADEGNEGALYLGSVYADAAGNFQWYGDVKGPNVTATASDTVSGLAQPWDTSPFSEPIPVQTAEGHTLLVTTTADTGEGSLREALRIAGNVAGEDTVIFKIPETDPGYNSTAGVWTITPTITLYVYANTIVDGRIFVAPDNSRPGIEINGTILAQSGMTGIRMYENTVLRGLTVNRCQYGIWIAGSGAAVEDCYVGIDPVGNSVLPNGLDGILVSDGVTNAVIQNNVVSGNKGNGIRMFGESTAGDTIRNNFIGTNAAGNAALANGNDGVQLHNGVHDNVIEGNTLSGNIGIGIHLLDAGTDNNLIRNNIIGADASGTQPLPNGIFGIALFNGPNNNVVGPDNLVANNNMDGVLVDGSDVIGSTVGNTITANRITANGGKGIRNFRSGNNELAPPQNLVAMNAANLQVSGTAGADQTIELFADEDDEGKLYVGSTTADAAGNFVFTVTEIPESPYLTATATDIDGNTSEFSQPIATAIEQAAENPIPGSFYLSQNYPNPFNPETEIRFDIPNKSHVTIRILNILGQEVKRLVDKEMAAGSYSVRWDGSDQYNHMVAGGIYFCQMKTDRFNAVRKIILMK
ncbi:MAG: right-handed parallel beta-helix repeat-containing protein [Calditrichia bacterium]